MAAEALETMAFWAVFPYERRGVNGQMVSPGEGKFQEKRGLGGACLAQQGFQMVHHLVRWDLGD